MDMKMTGCTIWNEYHRMTTALMKYNDEIVREDLKIMRPTKGTIEKLARPVKQKFGSNREINNPS